MIPGSHHIPGNHQARFDTSSTAFAASNITILVDARGDTSGTAFGTSSKGLSLGVALHRMRMRFDMQTTMVDWERLNELFAKLPAARRRTNKPWHVVFYTHAQPKQQQPQQSATRPQPRRCKTTAQDRRHYVRRRFLQRLRR